MIKFSYEVTDEAGIHARPASMLVKLASGLDSRVIIGKGGREADASKIFAVMALGAKKGDELEIMVEGDTEEADAEKVRAFLRENL